MAANIGQAFLGLAHEPLELCLEFWIPVPLARGVGLPGRVGLLDGEVDLPSSLMATTLTVTLSPSWRWSRMFRT